MGLGLTVNDSRWASDRMDQGGSRNRKPKIRNSGEEKNKVDQLELVNFKDFHNLITKVIYHFNGNPTSFWFRKWSRSIAV